MLNLLSVLATATVLFAFGPAEMFAICGPAFLLVDLISLVLKVVDRRFGRRHFVEGFDSEFRMAIEELGPELGQERHAALVWLHRARVLVGYPVHATVCLLGIALLGTCFLPLTGSAGGVTFSRAPSCAEVPSQPSTSHIWSRSRHAGGGCTSM